MNDESATEPTPVFTISSEQVEAWTTELADRIKAGEWDPLKWGQYMQHIHRKICAATYLAHQQVLARTEAEQARSALSATQREYDPDVAPCDDAEFGMKP